MSKRSKLSGSHSTLIPVADILYQHLRHFDYIKKVGAGRIRAGLHSVPTRIKIKDETGCILLVVRGPTVCQDIRIYALKPADAKLEIARFVRDRDWRLAFSGDSDEY